MTLVDTHCHLDSKEFDADREQVIERARDAGVGRMVAIGTGNGPPDLETGIRLAEKYEFFYATVGIHPHDAAKATDEDVANVERLLAHPKAVAVGEIGLDYHYDFAPKATQHEIFTKQIRIAASARKPIVIHTREAWADTFDLLRTHWAPAGVGGIMHCFSGGPQEAEQALEMGFYLSFGGIVTYPKALDVQEAARLTPLDRILVETDAPYLAPVPKRGKRNEPALVVHTVNKLATLRGQTPEEIADATTKNFERLCLRYT